MPRLPEIFIGSPTESHEIASQIARELSEHGFTPKRWWLEFPSGSYTLDRLIEIAKQVDGAILIGTGVDTVISRSIEEAAPRDNVILEYGLFIGALGRKRCMLLLDSGTKLPTDALAITHFRIGTDIQSVAERVVFHFREVFYGPELHEPKDTPVIADQKIVEIALDEAQRLPKEWHQRQLYYGAEGALSWLSLTEDKQYLASEYYEWCRKAAVDLARSASPSTLVSLGPGDARVDRAVMVMLRSQNKSVGYIPVDICGPLLYRAIGKISEVANVPVGILGDFEERLQFITKHVLHYGKGPFTYSLLGGTLGNFDDEDESGFLLQLRATVRPGDSVLLGVSLAGELWSKEADPRCDLATMDWKFRKFISGGVSRSLGLTADECAELFPHKVTVRLREVGDSKSVPPHRVIEYWWKHDDGKEWLCTRICRYSINRIIAECHEVGFTCKTTELHTWPVDTSTPVRFALLLLRPIEG